jgi:hypothetical protein
MTLVYSAKNSKKEKGVFVNLKTDRCGKFFLFVILCRHFTYNFYFIRDFAPIIVKH